MVKLVLVEANERYGRWTTLEEAPMILKPDGKRCRQWVCMCDCGTIKAVRSQSLKSGNSKSCGCLQREIAAEEIGNRTRTHGYAYKQGKRTKEYRTWANIKTRVTNPKSKFYPIYGPLGMEEDWKNNFLSFLEDIGEAPKGVKYCSIERINNTIGYFRGNVRWCTSATEQARNQGIRKDCKSGVRGVYCSDGDWVAAWQYLDGRSGTRHFSINKYGNEEAFALACKAREEMIKELNEQGAGYAPTHGHSR